MARSQPNRNIREVPVLFSGMQYAPSLSPYAELKTGGIPTMDNVRFDREAIGAVTAVEGYEDQGRFIQETGVDKCGQEMVHMFSQTQDMWSLFIAEKDLGSVVTIGGRDYTLPPRDVQLTKLKSDGAAAGQNDRIVDETAGYLGEVYLTNTSLVPFEDNLYFFAATWDGGAAGSDLTKKVTMEDTSTVTDAGLTRLDVSSATTTVAGSGAVRGIVKYYISEINGTTEGALSVAFGEVDAAEGSTITVGNGNTLPDPNTRERRLYRTFADGDQPFFLTSLDAGTTVFTDNIADVDLGDEPFAHGDQPPTDQVVSAIRFANRIFALTLDGDLLFSDPFEAESWWTAANGNVIPINKSDGDRGTALIPLPEGIGIFKQNNLYVLRGRSPSQFSLRKVGPEGVGGSSIGTPTHRSVVGTPMGVFFYYNQGIYHWGGGLSSPRLISGPIFSALSSLTIHDEWRISLFHDQTQNMVLVSFPLNDDNDGAPTHTYMLDLSSGSLRWNGRMTYGLNGAVLSNWEGGDWSQATAQGWQMWGLTPDTLPSAGDARDKVITLFDGTDFGGTAATAKVGFPLFSPDPPSALKTFLYVDLLFDAQSSGNFTVNYFIDGKSTGSSDITVTQVESGFSRNVKRVNIGEMGRELLIEVSTTALTPKWRLYGGVFGYTQAHGTSR